MSKDPNRLHPSPSVGYETPEQPRQGPTARNGSTTEQLRADIDSGRTRDKVDYPDPAAAPLGTDAEAGGAPPSPASISADRERAVDQLSSRRKGAIRPQAARPWLIGLIVAATVIASIAVLFADWG